MKTQNLFSMLMLVLMAFSFNSCADDDDTVDASQLTGLWFVKEPVLKDDFVTSYTFNADKTCEIYTGSPSSNGVPLYCTYEMNHDKKIITIYNKERDYTELYHILKLTFHEMEWENASPKDGNSDKRLEKEINYNNASN